MRALEGIRILDFSHVIAGPFCTAQLGLLGAEIIKVEEPGGGDELRALGPPFIGGESVFFLSINRNKKSVAVDLKDAENRDRIREIARSVDVIVENFRPGVMERLGLGWAELRRANSAPRACGSTRSAPAPSAGN